MSLTDIGSPPKVEVVPAPPLAAATVPRLGLIALATDLTFERDAARLLSPDEAALHTARVAFENPTTPETLRAMAPRLTEAASLLVPGAPLAAICYACTAASVAIGDEAVARAVHAARPGVPVVTPVSAALAAFRALGVSRVALIAPYLARTAQPMVARFTQAGLTVTRAVCFGMEDDRDMARIDPGALVSAACALEASGAEALFLSCTALPAAGVAGRIEEAVGLPVVTSNTASLWAMRRLAGLTDKSAGCGRLMGLPLPRGVW